jgi:nucleoside-triphosphatase THEP1
MHVLVTGPRDVGKTTFVRRVVDRLERQGLDPVGFYTVTADADRGQTADGNRKRTAAASRDPSPASVDRELVAVSTGERVPFAAQGPVFDEFLRVGRFYVDRDAVERGLAFADRDGDVLVADELGTLERRGEGFAPLLDRVAAGRYDRSLLAVRADCAAQFRDRVPERSTVTLIRLTPGNRDDRVSEAVSLLAGTPD